MVNGYWVELHPEDYIIEINEGGFKRCMIGIMAHEKPFILLGASFLRGYYSIHDMTNDRIGLSPTKISPKQQIVLGKKPTLR